MQYTDIMTLFPVSFSYSKIFEQYSHVPMTCAGGKSRFEQQTVGPHVSTFYDRTSNLEGSYYNTMLALLLFLLGLYKKLVDHTNTQAFCPYNGRSWLTKIVYFLSLVRASIWALLLTWHAYG